jgi:hypothetical protein
MVVNYHNKYKLLIFKEYFNNSPICKWDYLKTRRKSPIYKWDSFLKEGLETIELSLLWYFLLSW